MVPTPLPQVIRSAFDSGPSSPPSLNEWFLWHQDPTMLSLVRICARLPAETRATLEQYLNGCFLDAVTAKVEADGALKLDTFNQPDAPAQSCDGPAEQSDRLRELLAAIQR
jgi:hypothetical protein